VREPATAIATTGSLLADARAGVAYVVRNPTLRSLAMTISLANLALSAAEIAVPAIVMTGFGASQFTVGAVWGAMGAAGLVSASLAGRLDTAGLERPLVALPLLGTGLATALLLSDAGVWVVFLAAILIGLVMGPLDVAMMTARQRVTDPAWMGRAFAVSMALNGLGAPFGALAGGWLVASSIDAAIVFSVVVSLVAGLVAAVTMQGRPRAREAATEGA
jgi:predicted MFS family arabinose efflux permease